MIIIVIIFCFFNFSKNRNVNVCNFFCPCFVMLPTGSTIDDRLSSQINLVFYLTLYKAISNVFRMYFCESVLLRECFEEEAKPSRRKTNHDDFYDDDDVQHFHFNSMCVVWLPYRTGLIITTLPKSHHQKIIINMKGHSYTIYVVLITNDVFTVYTHRAHKLCSGYTSLNYELHIESLS